MAKLPQYNLDDLPDSPDIPKGRYRAKLLTAIKKKSRVQRLPMIEWKWKIILGKMKGLTILSWTMLSDDPRALAMFKQHMIALGRKKRSGGTTDDLLGRVVTLIIAVRKYRDANGDLQTASGIKALLPKDAPLNVEEEGDEELGIEEDEEEEEEEDDEGEEEEEKDEEEEDEEKDEDEEEEEDEDEDEDEEPVKKPPKKKAKAKKKKRRREANEGLPF